MRIQTKGRNISVPDELQEHVEKRFKSIGKQVSELARLDVEMWEERNPANPEKHVAEVSLHLKGAILRARDHSPTSMQHAINLCCEELSRQVKRDRVKRRHRREARASKRGISATT
ncbi:MAG TPA: ribosome-associated translation inhibitor RaiA [Baekduia sp.]|nr:ribosome-associated translation inhibitor RaiA [Baekduia sp.]